MNEQEELNNTDNEDIIWIIYIIISLVAIYSNNLHRKYIYTNNKTFYNQEKNINIILAFISVLIYLYFLSLAKKDKNNNLILISSYLFLFAGLINLYIEITTNDSNFIDFI